MVKNTFLYLIITTFCLTAYGMEPEEKKTAGWASLPPEIKATIFSHLQTASTFETALKQIRALSPVSKEFQHLATDPESLKIYFQYYTKLHPEETKKDLFDAVKAMNVEKVKTFLMGGFNPNVFDSTGMTPLLHAVSEAITVYDEEAFKRSKELLNLLLKYGANVNTPDTQYGRTPLMIPVGFGLAGLVKFLLEHGADKTIKDIFGKTALAIAQKELKEIDRLPEDYPHKADLKQAQLEVIQILQ